MRLSTRLFINVLGMTFNFSSAVVFALLHQPVISVLSVLLMMVSYHGVQHVMSFLDACEEVTGENNEKQD